MKIRTQSIHFSADEKLLVYIHQKISKLKAFFNRIQEANIVLELDNTNNRKSSIAEIKIYIPNGVIYIKEKCGTFESALCKAFVMLKVQLMKYKVKSLQRGRTPQLRFIL